MHCKRITDGSFNFVLGHTKLTVSSILFNSSPNPFVHHCTLSCLRHICCEYLVTNHYVSPQLSRCSILMGLYGPILQELVWDHGMERTASRMSFH